MKKYKRYLDSGDSAITKTTSRRYNISEDSQEIAEVIHSHSLTADDVTMNHIAHETSEKDVTNNKPKITDSTELNDDIMDIDSNEMCYNKVDDRWNDNYDDCKNSDDWITNFIKYLSDEDDVDGSKEFGKNMNNFKDLFNDENFFNKITTSIDKSRGEILLKILKYSLVNNLLLTTISNLLKILGQSQCYLHSCLEGIGQQFTSYFMESLSDDEIKVLAGKSKNKKMFKKNY